MIAASIALALTGSVAAEPRCELPGTAEHWLHDACMYEGGTDDDASPSVQVCVKRMARALQPFNACTRKRILKEKICRSMANYTGVSVQVCQRDPEMIGPTVRNGGL